MQYQIVTPGLAVNTYLVVDPVTGDAAVIDPARNIAPIIEKIGEVNGKIVAILETHVHADFVSGAVDLKSALKGQPEIICSGLGGPEWVPVYADRVIRKDRESISLGSIRLEAWHTPGHTPEHVMWVLYDEKNVPIKAFTGDFLFIGSVGRPDLLGESALKKLADQQYHSIFTVLPQLPDSVEVYPAHGAGSLCGKNIGSRPSSTLQIERQSNIFLKMQPKEDWINSLMKNMPPSPPYFKRMKKVNLGVPYMEEKLNKEFILDIRTKEEFAEKHFRGAINIGFNPSFVNWASVIVPYNSPIMIVGSDPTQIQQAIRAMKLVGFDGQINPVVFNEKQGSEYESLRLISARELRSAIKSMKVIDVRSDQEWENGHIEGAQHIILSNLLDNLSNLKKDEPIAVICGSGYRSSIGASLLQKNGFTRVSNVQGGMQEWIKTGG